MELAIKETPIMVWRKKHSTVINSTVQLAGFGLSLYFTAKEATALEKERQAGDIGESTKEKAQAYAKHYWKPMLIYTATGVYTVFINRKAAIMNATLSAALLNAQNQYMNYRQAVKETVKPGKMEEIQQSADRKDISGKPVSSNVLDTGRGTELFMDKWTGQLYLSSVYNERNAFLSASQYLLNSTCGCVTLNYLNDARGLMWSAGGEFLGWDTYDGNYNSIDYILTPQLTSEVPGIPASVVSQYDHVTVVEYVPRPIDDYRNWTM